MQDDSTPRASERRHLGVEHHVSPSKLGGRRRYDHSPRNTVTRKDTAVIVAVINAAALVLEALLVGGHVC